MPRHTIPYMDEGCIEISRVNTVGDRGKYKASSWKFSCHVVSPSEELLLHFQEKKQTIYRWAWRSKDFSFAFSAETRRRGMTWETNGVRLGPNDDVKPQSRFTHARRNATADTVLSVENRGRNNSLPHHFLLRRHSWMQVGSWKPLLRGVKNV